MEPVTFDEFYEAYGERLAGRVVAINHSAAEPAFLFVEDIGDPKEVTAWISAGKGEGPNGPRPVLIWENFQEDINTGGRDNYHSAVVGSMMVIRKGVDRAGKRQAIRECRQALLKVLAVMIQDGEAGELNEQGIVVDVTDLPCEPLTGLTTNWHGYGVQFRWTVPIDLTLDPADVQEVP